MQVVTLVRTRNEERNIGAFCEAYQGIADHILVADGGSEDRTIDIAEKYRNVIVRPFREQIIGLDGSLRNPEGRHVNFLIDWGRQVAASDAFFIFDDCDCIPNYYLREQARRHLAWTTGANPDQAIFVHRIYFWG